MTTFAKAQLFVAPALLLLAACGPAELPPRAQLVLHVTTDAPLPAVGTQPAALENPTPLFDRLTIEIIPRGTDEACTDCVREEPLDESLVDAGQASMGVVPGAEGAEYLARVRVFLAELEVLGEPQARTTLETVVALPPVVAGEVTHGHVVLHTDDVGTPVGTLDDPVSWSEGWPPENLAGTWPGAARSPCSIEPSSNEVCVPGGAFWMGRLGVEGGAAGEDSPHPRLVNLAPFLMDRNEVTVQELRASGLALPPSADDPGDPLPWSGQSSGIARNDYCTFSPNAGENDQYPVNCISFETARAYCQSRGADLPSEAQFEYVAGALRQSLYPWGSTPPSCPDAVHSRGGFNVASSPTSGFPDGCRGDEMGGALPVGSGLRDRLPMGDGREIVDLAGNVMEYVRDVWSLQSEPCWLPSLLKDPVCEQRSTDDEGRITLRGGGWMAAPAKLRSAFRRSLPDDDDFGIFVGFRCVRPASEP